MLPASSVIISEQYPSSNGGHVAGASATYESHALRVGEQATTGTRDVCVRRP